VFDFTFDRLEVKGGCGELLDFDKKLRPVRVSNVDFSTIATFMYISPGILSKRGLINLYWLGMIQHDFREIDESFWFMPIQVNKR